MKELVPCKVPVEVVELNEIPEELLTEVFNAKLAMLAAKKYIQLTNKTHE